MSVMLLPAAMPAFAQDAAAARTDLARPSGGERASPAEKSKAGAQKPAETARDSDAREALCGEGE